MVAAKPAGDKTSAPAEGGVAVDVQAPEAKPRARRDEQVSLSQLFRYATSLDYLLVTLATAGACGSGARI